MAKKARKKVGKKTSKKSAAKRKTKRKTAAKRKPIRKARPKSVADKISGAYRTVIDTFKGTDRLRNKLEPPGTSETE